MLGAYFSNQRSHVMLHVILSSLSSFSSCQLFLGPCTKCIQLVKPFCQKLFIHSIVINELIFATKALSLLVEGELQLSWKNKFYINHRAGGSSACSPFSKTLKSKPVLYKHLLPYHHISIYQQIHPHVIGGLFKCTIHSYHIFRGT